MVEEITQVCYDDVVSSSRLLSLLMGENPRMRFPLRGIYTNLKRGEHMDGDGSSCIKPRAARLRIFAHVLCSIPA